jgi:hypothetical protein
MTTLPDCDDITRFDGTAKSLCRSIFYMTKFCYIVNYLLNDYVDQRYRLTNQYLTHFVQFTLFSILEKPNLL